MEALADFNRVNEMRCGLRGGATNRGEVLSQLGRWQEAVDDYTVAPDTAGRSLAVFRAAMRCTKSAKRSKPQPTTIQPYDSMANKPTPMLVVATCMRPKACTSKQRTIFSWHYGSTRLWDSVSQCGVVPFDLSDQEAPERRKRPRVWRSGLLSS